MLITKKKYKKIKKNKRQTRKLPKIRKKIKKKARSFRKRPLDLKRKTLKKRGGGKNNSNNNSNKKNSKKTTFKRKIKKGISNTKNKIKSIAQKIKNRFTRKRNQTKQSVENVTPEGELDKKNPTNDKNGYEANNEEETTISAGEKKTKPTEQEPYPKTESVYPFTREKNNTFKKETGNTPVVNTSKTNIDNNSATPEGELDKHKSTEKTSVNEESNTNGYSGYIPNSDESNNEEENLPWAPPSDTESVNASVISSAEESKSPAEEQGVGISKENNILALFRPNSAYNEPSNELSSTNNELSSTNNELSSTNNELSSTNNELSNTNTQQELQRQPAIEEYKKKLQNKDFRDELCRLVGWKPNSVPGGKIPARAMFSEGNIKENDLGYVATSFIRETEISTGTWLIGDRLDIPFVSPKYFTPRPIFINPNHYTSDEQDANTHNTNHGMHSNNDSGSGDSGSGDSKKGIEFNNSLSNSPYVFVNKPGTNNDSKENNPGTQSDTNDSAIGIGRRSSGDSASGDSVWSENNDSKNNPGTESGTNDSASGDSVWSEINDRKISDSSNDNANGDDSAGRSHPIKRRIPTRRNSHDSDDSESGSGSGLDGGGDDYDDDHDCDDEDTICFGDNKWVKVVGRPMRGSTRNHSPYYVVVTGEIGDTPENAIAKLSTDYNLQQIK